MFGKIKLAFVLIAALPLSLFSQSTFAPLPKISDAIQYVSTNGNDANDGLSAGSPKLTQAGAISWCSSNAPNGCTVFTLNGTYNISTSISAVSNLDFECADPAATLLNWTGSSSGVELLIQNVNNVTVHNCQFRTTGGSTSMAIEIVNSNQVSIDHNFILNSTYPVQANGFGTAIRVTGDGSSLNSSTIWITHNFIRDNAVAGINLDHCVDCHLNMDSIYGVFNNTTSINLIFDRGVSGLYVSQVPTGAGLNGFLMRNTNQGGAYGPAAPVFSFFDQFLADTITGGDACKFDSSLGASNVSAHFTNSWCAFAGMTTGGVVTTATANGVHISGGQGIYLEAGFRSRVNAANGVLVDNSNVQNVSIDGASIYANNLNNGADAHGIYWQSGSDLTISGSHLTNTVGADSGHQLYGLKVTGGSSFALSGNDLTGNVTGAVSNSVAQLDAAGNVGINDEISNSRCLQFDHAGDTLLCPNSLVGTYTLSVPAITGTLLPAIYATSASSTGNLGSTTMSTAGAAGNRYRFTAYVDQSALGASCTGGTSTLVLNVVWTDPAASSTSNFNYLNNYTVATNNGTVGVNTATGGFGQEVLTIQAKANTTVSYSTTYSIASGCSPAPQYTVYPTLELLN